MRLRVGYELLIGITLDAFRPHKAMMADQPDLAATNAPDEVAMQLQRFLPSSFGAINLEDISQPKCFRVLDELRLRLGIPVWHDDQQGSATVALAGLLNALKVVGKRLNRVRIAMIEMGAANVATYRLLCARGVNPGSIVACDRKGTLHRDREDIAEQQADFADKWQVCRESNALQVKGGIAQALAGTDVCIAFSSSGPDVIQPAWIQNMAERLGGLRARGGGHRNHGN